VALSLGLCHLESTGSWAQTAAIGNGAAAPTTTLLDRDFADPSVLQAGSQTFLYGTNAGSTNVQVARSNDLVHWAMLADALPDLPAWVQAGYTWAPSVAALGGARGYVLYFVAHDRASGRQCIGVASSPRPEGPFQSPGARPLLCQVDLGGSIDPAAFVDDDGGRYLLWKNDGNCCQLPVALWIQPLTDDGLSLSGSAVRLLSPDQAWEGTVVEAPSLSKRDGQYYLWYSANSYLSTQYAIGYATSATLLGPYRKTTGPLLATSTTGGAALGPGGEDILAQSDNTWLVYHAWDPTLTYRRPGLARLQWQGATPVVDLGVSLQPLAAAGNPEPPVQ
jgi:beta-xylosidase